MNGADLLFKVLNKQGVKDIFGYPGGAIMPIYDALHRSSGVKHHLCRQEQGAAFAALGYAKAANTVGVCFATSGPGMTNLITGLADANADSVPVVAITGQVPTTLMGTDAFQEVDVLGLAIQITKHSFQVKSIDDLEETLYKAFEIATSGRPGAVLVDIPKDIQLSEVESKPISLEKFQLPVADDSSIEQAREVLSSSKKPIAYIGGGVALGHAVDELRDFIAQTNIPNVSTLKGLGSLDADQPSYLGMLGMHGTKAANLAVQECDLLIAIGARFDDRVTGKLAEFAPNARVIHLDLDPVEVNKLRTSTVRLIGDLKHSLPKLATDLSIEDWRETCLEMKQKYHFNYMDLSLVEKSQPIHAPSMLNLLSQIKPANTVITTDVGQHQMWAAQHMDFDHPNDWLTSGALGTMGFGLPAAIGAQVSRPKDCVIAVTGDGSFLMNIQELGTIKRFNLPVKILLIDNSRLGMVRQWQQLFFEQRFSEVDLSDNPDFLKLAQAFDIDGETINTHQDVEAGLKRMLNHKGAYLLHVSIDESQNVWPLVPPNTPNQDMLEE
jgi:acetolactate synthase-1/2/3 large subunit